MEYPEFKVCVRCFTFNQSQYIKDALNGFVMQQTDFPFVCCIVDDASTDGEQEVIRKYVSDNFDLSEGSCHFERETDYAFITYAQHKTNKNCYFAVLYLKENHYSIKKPKMPYLAEWRNICEYEAMCEGDDYWISEEKLQILVGFLNVRNDYSFVCHAHYQKDPDGSMHEIRLFTHDEDIIPMETLINNGGMVSINAMCYRINKLPQYPDWAKNLPVGDIQLRILLAYNGKTAYLDKLYSCYRSNSAGSWTERMCNDATFRRIHFIKMSNMWKEFDVWSQYQYHQCIKEKLFSLRKNYYSFVIHYLLYKLHLR